MVDIGVLLQFVVNVCFGVGILLIHFRGNKMNREFEVKLQYQQRQLRMLEQKLEELTRGGRK